jgi:hypothetical protein
MIINFDHREITQAIVDYTKKRGIGLENSKIEVNLTAGRGPNGYTASVDIIEDGIEPLVEVAEEIVKTTQQTVPEVIEEATKEAAKEDTSGDAKSLFES